jgi:tetratricopeptide (TPR) repeat protein
MLSILRKKTFLVAVVFVVVGLCFVFFPKKRDTFYPSFINEKSDNIQINHLYQLFQDKKYSTITTYVDDILPYIGQKNKLRVIFYQAESYFLLKQYGMAWKKFFTLYENYPKIWQVILRLAAIQIIDDNLAPVQELFDEIHSNAYEVFYWKGRYFEAKGSYQKANDEYLKSNVSSSEVSYRLGMNYYRLKENLKAQKFLDKVLDPNFEFLKDVDVTLFNIAFKKKDLPEMKKYEQRVSRFYDTDSNLVAQIAKDFYSLGDKQTALRIYSNLGTENNLTLITAQTLFDLYYDLGYYKKAIYFGTIFKFDAARQANLARSYLALNRNIKAIITAKRILKDFSLTQEQKQEVEYILFQGYKNNKVYSTAMQIIESLLSKDPSLENIKKAISLYELLQPRYSSRYKELLKLEYEKDPTSFKKVVLSLYKHRYYNEEQEFLNAFLQKDPNNIMALYYKASLLFALHDVDQSKAILTQILNIPMQDENKDLYFEAMYSLGSIKLSQNLFDDAIFWLEKAQKIKQDVRVTVRLAYAYFSLKDYKKSYHIIHSIKESEVSFLKMEKPIFDFLKKNLNPRDF